MSVEDMAAVILTVFACYASTLAVVIYTGRRIDRLNEHLNRLDSRIDRLSEHLNSRIDRLSEHLDRVRARSS